MRAMPAVFVLIWATGFIVARYGMPHSPPLKFLSVRYALSSAAFLAWALVAGAAWPRDRAQALHLAVTDVTRMGGDVQIRLRPTRHTGGPGTTGGGS